MHSNGLDESKQQCDSKENTIKSNDRLGLSQEQNSNMPEKHYITSRNTKLTKNCSVTKKVRYTGQMWNSI